MFGTSFEKISLFIFRQSYCAAQAPKCGLFLMFHRFSALKHVTFLFEFFTSTLFETFNIDLFNCKKVTLQNSNLPQSTVYKLPKLFELDTKRLLIGCRLNASRDSTTYRYTNTYSLVHPHRLKCIGSCYMVNSYSSDI